MLIAHLLIHVIRYLLHLPALLPAAQHHRHRLRLHALAVLGTQRNQLTGLELLRQLSQQTGNRSIVALLKATAQFLLHLLAPKFHLSAEHVLCYPFRKSRNLFLTVHTLLNEHPEEVKQQTQRKIEL